MSARDGRAPHPGAVLEATLLAVRQLAERGGWAPVAAVTAYVARGRLRPTEPAVRDAIYWLVRLGSLERCGPEQVRIARHR